MNHNDKEHGASATEAWADHEHNDPDTNVNIPSEAAVINAKEWIENNEL